MSKSSQAPLRAAVVGATGLAGQQFLAALNHHPTITITHLAASPRSAGKKYLDAISSNGHVQWHAGGDLPKKYAKMTVFNTADLPLKEVDLVFTAVESDAARDIEPALAQHLPVISTASAFRYEDDAPLLLPGVNYAHAALLKTQQKNRGWKGFISAVPNSTTTGLALTLAPLHQHFGVKQVVMVSMQALSGAGRSPGVLALDILDNVIPYIPKEEEKVELETRKILGTVGAKNIKPAPIVVSSTCTRVNVRDGHTEAVFVSLKKKATLAQVREAMEKHAPKEAKGLPSTPKQWIHVKDDPFRPQPRLDRDTEDGMCAVVGRLREDTVLENGVKYVLLSHNTKIGAAKGAVSLAEFYARAGLIKARV